MNDIEQRIRQIITGHEKLKSDVAVQEAALDQARQKIIEFDVDPDIDLEPLLATISSEIGETEASLTSLLSQAEEILNNNT